MMETNELTVTYVWPQGTKVSDFLLANEIIEIFGPKGALRTINVTAGTDVATAQFEIAGKTHPLPTVRANVAA